MLNRYGQHKHQTRYSRRSRSLGAKPVLLIVLIAVAVVAIELTVSAVIGPAQSNTQQNQTNEEQQEQQADTETEEQDTNTEVPDTQTSNTDAPDASEAAEREAIAAWLTGRGISSNASDGVRVKSEAGKTTTQDADGNEIEIPIVTSYWRVNGSYVVVTDRQGQHYVAPLTETVEGVNDGGDVSADGSVTTSNSNTGAAIPDKCMETLYDRLGAWVSDSGTDFNAGEAYVDESSIAVNDTTVTFDMRGPNLSRQSAVVHVTYDTDTDNTTFNS